MTIPKECKRLAEVDFPIAVVSKHSAREKSIRHGHPSTLHLWWARRPLAACRAMLLGLLLPDPCDPHCPADFKPKARELLAKLAGGIGPQDEDLRRALLRFIGDFADWDVSSHPVWLEVGRGLVKAAHPEETPLVVDPFAGGGSIPLEALRLGCDAFSSDLNPVACLIQKVLLEDIPRHGPELADELRRVGAEVKKAAEKELAEFYPPDPDGARPIAYLWARTIRCEAPNCGAEIPLVRSFWLCKKPSRKHALNYTVARPKGNPPHLVFEIILPSSDADVPSGTISRAKATCPCCNVSLGPDRVRAQLRDQRGGADTVFDKSGNRIGGAMLLAVVALRPGEQGRHYRLPVDRDYQSVFKSHHLLGQILANWERQSANKREICPLPVESIPLTELRRISMPIYGMTRWLDCFTTRQAIALLTLVSSVASAGSKGENARLLALAVSRLVNALNTICRWHLSRENIEGAYSRQALGMVWDFCEGSLASESTGSFSGALDWILAVIRNNECRHPAQVERADACATPNVSDAAHVWFTDPPYYDSVPYSHLSDFVYVWLRRVLTSDVRLGFDFEATPKTEECVVDRPHSANPAAKSAPFYESKMAAAMAEGRRVTMPTGVGCVVFAHKTTEGWESLLSGIIRGNWTITASWPIATEMSERLNARDTASLATSVQLVCRPRPENAGIGDWAQVVRELPKRVGDWMERLQGEGIRGADLVFACIGPALEIYSRYEKVVDAEEREIPLGGNPEATDPHERGYLAYVWEVVGRVALEQVLGTAEAKARNGAAGALEEDARLTALYLWTMQTTDADAATGEADADEDDTADDDEDDDAPRGKKKAGFSLPFDVVRRFAQPLGIHLPEWERRIIETEKGVVRLLPVSERAKLLFGDEGADAVAEWLQSAPAKTGSAQMTLFGEEPPTPKASRKGRGKTGQNVSDESLRARREATTLDRVHMAMLLQASGRTNALRALLQNEQDRGPDFVRLSNALSALYPKDSEEKRLLDAMLLAVPR
jgi:adenine-specific DNA methylase